MIVALPTNHGCLFLLAAIISLAVAFINVGLATALVASVLCSIALSSFLMAQFSIYRLRVKRGAVIDGVCGSKMSLPLHIQNRMPWSRQAFVLSEKCLFAEKKLLHTAVEPMGAWESRTLDRRVRAVRRGLFDLKDLSVIGGDPAGFFRRSRKIRMSGKIMISPKIVHLESIQLQLNRKVMPGSDGRPLGIAGQGHDFFGIRPYRPGDEMRFVHWKSTAAKKKLMVREFEANTIEHIVILLDSCRADFGMDPFENNFEMLISMAASMISFLSGIYCHVTFITHFNDTGFTVIHGDSAGVKGKVLSILTEIQPSEESFDSILERSMESMEPGAVLYAFSMSNSARTTELLSILSNQNVYLRWYYAPKINFPFLDPEMARIIQPSKVPLDPHAPVRPTLLAFNTRPEDVLQ